jgi:hypothetical protein
MYGANRLFDAINITTVTDLLDDYGTGSAIFPSTLIPEAFTGTEVINFYRTSSNASGLAYNEHSYTINCRSKLEINSIILMQAVDNALNRTEITDGLIYSINKGQTIPPLDETDVYNTPLTVTIKSK